MKALVCEMCGSNDLVKQEGVFVCQSCGCKYSVEEAKKLMIEVSGSVSIEAQVEVKGIAQVETMLENLEEVLEEGMAVPLSGGKRMVDVDAARDIIDDIRINMPQEILQAKAIVQDRAQILAKAKKEAEEMVRAAEERARKLLDREEIVRQAEEKAKTITSEANQQASQLRATVTKYCDNMLATTQERLQKSFNEMKIVRDNLKK